MKTLEGKVAVITGGSSGIGLATARLFQEVGARVAISGRNQKALDAAVKELGAGIVAVRSDVSKLSDLDTLFDVVTKRLGRIDVLFANAGIAKFASVSDVSEDSYDETFDINVKRGVLHCPEGNPLPERQCLGHSEHVVRQSGRRSNNQRLRSQ
jgi:NAD(P)-dependent dehydrogenase (short-subunit alcohol dehydrogenase family)